MFRKEYKTLLKLPSGYIIPEEIVVNPTHGIFTAPTIEFKEFKATW